MNQDYIKPDPWSIIEEGFDAEKVKSSESLFSIGNGAMGQRANFEEDYSGETFQGSYVAGVYYPDKTRVGWWKNGYPEYFAKVLNAPNWIGLKVSVNGENLDLHHCKEVKNFRRELNMKEGFYRRSFEVTMQNGTEIAVTSTRILHLDQDELGIINYEVTPLNRNAEIVFSPYLDGGITNEDSNWDDKFWDTLSVSEADHQAFIRSMTMKTEFHICTYMQSEVYLNKTNATPEYTANLEDRFVQFNYAISAPQGETASLRKYAGYTVSLDHAPDALVDAAKATLDKGIGNGYENLKKSQAEAWTSIWEMADITIEGDVEAQQGIRFNIFQLNQTYLGKDARLNIGPKGFTGEKYGGSTYWDTEAYCLPFYMATKDHEVARNLLVYRHNHLQKAIENAEKLGFTNGAALYPMVTMNGEECHNEWEITFEEIHRNGAIAFAIYNYVRYTGDHGYVPEKGLEVLIGIARFWHQRANFSTQKNKYVILGVTGPNEYENNVNNNWYTNFTAKWCIEYAASEIEKVKEEYTSDYERIISKTGVTELEVSEWMKVASDMYFPFSEEHNIYLQQDSFLDKELITVADLDRSQRPINQQWSWDRILRSPYIKQADVLQGFYFYEDHFSQEELERHFDFYEPFTVHESSLSPCVHSIQAAKLGRMEQAYTFYLRTSRLDLDDYNKEVEEGCHITSMAGTWLSIVEGFGGMRVRDDHLEFHPRIPDHWKEYTFKVNFRGQILKATITRDRNSFELSGEQPLTIKVNGVSKIIEPTTY
ncbi:MAG: glycoside hydrolase family 65 protein [Bacteroidia bacterium]|nr:glycoside hydrolase family 65 protein [Bacteroidia bacterium]NNF31255.1 glycoside hydrolase family 65 protein [Flavobacteriaceae bacterium]MBT8275881.1 glycoside hydrolase family 65 protein [Bacteroidia bacterium]NNJ82940.1 glycoside hydrolase family 65 protein [Flavobacteriaceae bacterium]NNK54550.1 glycoside hydrolase family 65 protein [Flavobacteriaceae bacterium]